MFFSCSVDDIYIIFITELVWVKTSFYFYISSFNNLVRFYLHVVELTGNSFLNVDCVILIAFIY